MAVVETCGCGGDMAVVETCGYGGDMRLWWRHEAVVET